MNATKALLARLREIGAQEKLGEGEGKLPFGASKKLTKRSSNS